METQYVQHNSEELIMIPESIVNVSKGDLGIARNVRVVKLEVASNAFALAASFVLQEEDTSNVFILLDGDVYRKESKKRMQLKKFYQELKKIIIIRWIKKLWRTIKERLQYTAQPQSI